MHRINPFHWLILAAALIAGCGDDARLHGRWTDEDAMTRYDFAPDGRVDISVFDSGVEGEYAIEGDRLVITSPQGTVVLKIRDGRLEGPMGLILRPASPETPMPKTGN